jgi:hypothetical protein
MAYFAGGAWWTSNGQAFPTQAEATAYEQQVAAGSNGAGDSDEFATAMGRGNSGNPRPSATDQAAAGAPAGAAEQASFNASRPGGFDPRSTNIASGRTQGNNVPFSDAVVGGGYQSEQGGFVRPDVNTPLDALRQLGNNPVINPVGYFAGQVGNQINQRTGFDVSGYVQDPIGQGLNDLGAPDAVQAIANPTGYLNRNAVNAGTNYGTNVPAVVQNASSAANNLRNDAQNTSNAVRQIPNAIQDIAGNIAGAFRAPAGPQGAQAQYTPTPSPTPQMTSAQVMGYNTDAVRPSSAQSDAIVQQMLGQANQQSGYQDFNSPQYDQSRSAAMNYTSQLAGLANNNVAVTGLDSGRYDQSRGLMNTSYGDLRGQAQNNIGNIQADATQRNQSRNAVMDTASLLTGNANREIGPIQADQLGRTIATNDVNNWKNGLRVSATNDVADSYGDARSGLYLDSRAQSEDIIQRLIGASEAPESSSQAQALLLNAQERATRNAYGDANSLGGGWRSQITGQRRALGQAAAQQADIGAQMAALRASEEQQHRQNQLQALGLAGGYSGDMGARDLSLAVTDADRLAQIKQGNQENYRLSNAAGGQLAMAQLLDETGFTTSEADRLATTSMANQQNRLNSLLGAGGLQSNAMNSDTSLAQSNASIAAQIAQANQRNALDSYIAAGGLATNMNSNDLGFATNDAQIRTQRELANQQNALNALLGASAQANNTAGLDQGIGINNSNNRVTVDQNNRANSIAALQNAGVLSSATRAQDVQLSTANAANLTSRINAAAGISNSNFATEMSRITQIEDLDLRNRQFAFLQSQAPSEAQKWLNAAGQTAGILGLFI